jgi:hypothetical protein
MWANEAANQTAGVGQRTEPCLTGSLSENGKPTGYAQGVFGWGKALWGGENIRANSSAIPVV